MPEGEVSRRRYHQLKVWQDAIALTKLIYQVSGKFPVGERDGLALQIRRAAVSIPTVIAKGSERGGREQLTGHIEDARGNLAELETLWLLVQELGFIQPLPEMDERIEKLAQKLNQYLHSLESPAA